MQYHSFPLHGKQTEKIAQHLTAISISSSNPLNMTGTHSHATNRQSSASRGHINVTESSKPMGRSTYCSHVLFKNDERCTHVIYLDNARCAVVYPTYTFRETLCRLRYL